MTVRELISSGTSLLAEAGVEDSRLDAELLYDHITGLDRTHRILQYREEVTEEIVETYSEILARRAAGEPLQYITGVQEFMGLPFHVAPGVLIPRPETELLVEKAVAWAKSFCEKSDTARACRVLDIGCGSGAIGVSLAKLVPAASVTCTDISPAALEIARQNAARLSVDVEFLEGDLLAPVEGRKFDLILSNPPYIARDVVRGLAREVRDHEPEMALCGGEDGLDVYRQLASSLGDALQPGGAVMMEIGHDQREAVKKMLEETGVFAGIVGYRDLAGRDRIITGERIAEE